jgi:adenosine kinase
MSIVKVLVIGYPSFDRIMRVSRAPFLGETGIILDPPGIPQATLGGCACNIAVAINRLGIGAAPVIVLGDDHDGQMMLKKLSEENVETSCVHQISNGKTAGTFLYIDPDGGHQTFYFPGSADENIALQIPETIVEGLKYGVITVGNPFHTSMFVDQLSEAGIPLVWSLRNDPHAFPFELVERLVRTCSMLIMNEFEGKVLADMLGLKGFESLLANQVETIILTQGSRGSKVFQRENEFVISAVTPNNVLDPTGAGDAFVGGLLAGLCMGISVEKAAKIGACTSSFVIEKLGCQTNLPQWELMSRRYEFAFGESPA